MEPLEADRPPGVRERMLGAHDVHDGRRDEGEDPHGHQAGQARPPEHAEHDGRPDRGRQHPCRADQESGGGDPDHGAGDQGRPRCGRAGEGEAGQGVGGSDCRRRSTMASAIAASTARPESTRAMVRGRCEVQCRVTSVGPSDGGMRQPLNPPSTGAGGPGCPRRWSPTRSRGSPRRAPASSPSGSDRR